MIKSILGVATGVSGIALSACASMSFTPEGVCRGQGLAVPSPEYTECVQRTYAERRQEWWSDPQNQAAVVGGIAVGMAVNGWVPARPVSSTQTVYGSTTKRAGSALSTLPSANPLIAPPRPRLGGSSQSVSATTSSPGIGLCPDGSYVSGGRCYLAPSGAYVGGPPSLAPDGSYVGGSPRLAPNGQYVGGSQVVICPDGSYVGGTRCVLAPNGQYVGQ